MLIYILSEAAEKIEDRESAAEGTQITEEEAERGQIWLEFSEAVSLLLPKKIFEILQLPRLKVGERRLTMPESEFRNHASKFRKLFSLEREATPELIWESSMREELRRILVS